MKLNLVLKAVLIASFLNIISGYNILILFPFGSRSHKHVFDSVAQELAKRGHQITLYSSSKHTEKNISGITHIHDPEGEKIHNHPSMNFFKNDMNNITSLLDKLEKFKNFTFGFYNHPFVQGLIKEPLDPLTKRPKYDVVVVDQVLNEFTLPIAHHLGVPNILFSPTFLFAIHAWMLDIPYPPSYRPVGTVSLNEPMTFMDRALNSFMAAFFIVFFKFKALPMNEELIHKYLPNSPSTEELIRNVSFIMTNTHFAINSKGPTMPYYVEVGGLHCKPSKPLPKELEEYMQNAKEEGVIYFSLGSFTKGEQMPEEMKSKLIEAFSRVPQQILWKYEVDIPNLSNNVKLIKWAPQQDLLAHPQLRLFISHGGGLSTSEAAYHGCPILGFPLAAEQVGNIDQAKKLGFAEYLDWKTFTVEELVNLIKTMTNAKIYKEKAMQASLLVKDRPQLPVETAAYWIEYVVRHNGAPFLKTPAQHLNFFQYFLLDVLGVVLGILLVIGYIFYVTVRYLSKKLCNLIRGHHCDKEKLVQRKGKQSKKKTQ
ncbi:hypothetical protein CHUAL_000359 [Chamberlinius hualienensis]